METPSAILRLVHIKPYTHTDTQAHRHTRTHTHTHTHKHTYTGCNRRKGTDFGRVFLMLNYTEKPQNTYIQS